MGRAPPQLRRRSARARQGGAALAALLARRFPVDDGSFDELLPESVRQASELHWTPVAVALRAASWLTARRRVRVLDVGCGPGKFCVVAALGHPGQFVGVELRPAMVTAALKLASTLGARRARFIQGDALGLDWTRYGGLYLYSPFGELGLARQRRIDSALPGGEPERAELVRRAQSKLAAMPAGTRVVTYHGLGGAMPDGYERAKSIWIGTGYLELWER